MLSLFLRFLGVRMTHSTTVLHVLFVPSCTIYQFRFVCNVLWLILCTDTNTPHPLKHRWNWWQTPLSSNHRTSRANIGAPDPSPATVNPPARPHPVLSGPYNSLGQYSLSLQASFYHKCKRPKGLISMRDLMIPLPHLRIEIYIINTIPIQHLLPSLPLVRPCTAPILHRLFS